ncbi:hypothetical protein [Cupriavidus pauculus]|uniref:hypothetical protein n=1 Tax=Cupriavidus pauculus TaxID=82633 RepID=UPI001D0C1EB9|nr:hypothetical protein [Cupriavidus pauculus]
MANAEGTQTNAKGGAKKSLQFPRIMRIVNDTAVPYTVGRKLVKAGQSADIDVANEDALTRLKTNCKALVDLNGSYKDADPEKLPLRVEDQPA